MFSQIDSLSIYQTITKRSNEGVIGHLKGIERKQWATGAGTFCLNPDLFRHALFS